MQIRKQKQFDFGTPIYAHEIGHIKLEVHLEAENNPDFSYLGKFTDFVESPSLLCYHRDSGLAWDGVLWRNAKGQIQAEPEYARERGRREYRCIEVDHARYTRKDKHWFKYAYEDAKRLDRLGEDWCYARVVARVWLDEVIVGRSTCGDVEYVFWPKNDENSYIAEIITEQAWEALHDARPYALSLQESIKGVLLHA